MVIYRDTCVRIVVNDFHNDVRPHMGLDGQTPAERCGIKVEGGHKWLTLIQNTSHTKVR